MGRNKRAEEIYDVRFRVGIGVCKRVGEVGRGLGLTVPETFRYLALKSLEASTALSSLNSVQKMIETFNSELAAQVPLKPERKAKIKS